MHRGAAGNPAAPFLFLNRLFARQVKKRVTPGGASIETTH